MLNTFETFWQLYPRHIAKKYAAQQWAKLSTAQQEKAIEVMPMHRKAWADTEAQFIPHASTWLNQWRFDDEIEIAKPKAPAVQIAWWASEQGCLAKAREVGINARPGESLDQLKGRVAEALKRVA